MMRLGVFFIAWLVVFPASVALGLTIGSYTLPAEHCDIGVFPNANKEANSSAELTSLLAGAVAGDIIFVKNDAVYNASEYIISNSGTNGNPITITCDPGDRATFRQTFIRIQADYIRFSHCLLDVTEIEVQGDNNWVTRNESFGMNACSNQGFRESGITVIGDATNNKISHNELYNYFDCRGMRVTAALEAMGDNLFYRNYVHNFNQTANGSNSGEGFQCGVASDDSSKDLGCWFVENYSHDMCADEETISIKSVGNRVIRNTYAGPACWTTSQPITTRGSVVQVRDGDFNHLVANTILDISNVGTGLTILGRGNRVQDNAMLGGEDIVIRPGVHSWDNDPDDNQTVAAHETEIFHNNCDGNEIRIGYNITQSTSATTEVTDTDTWDNTNCTILTGNQSGHTALVVDPAVTRVTPLELTSLDVGLLAADPQCAAAQSPGGRHIPPIFFHQ